MIRVLGCITQEHDLRLVLLAAAICGLACFTTVAMLTRACSHHRSIRFAWIGGATLVFGCGVWTTHFIGMLAFMSNLVIGYEVGGTVLSFALVCSGAAIAFWLMSTERRHPLSGAVAALLLGGSIGAMHYAGIGAMHSQGVSSLAWQYVIGSVAAGVLLSYPALLRIGATHSFSATLVSAALLSAAVVALHFTGMAGLTIDPVAFQEQSGLLIGSGLLITAVCAVSFMILALSLFGSMVDQHLTLRTRREQSNLYHLAHHDPLTGLPNRLQTQERLARLIEGSAGDTPFVAVLCLDLDRFKQVNDLLGHQAGDQLLVQVAGRLKSLVRPTDLVARIGGDEFVIAMASPVTAASAAILAGRVVAAMGQDFWLDGQQVGIGTSVGIALGPVDGTTGADLLMNADTALYVAKKEGRALYRFFEASMGERLRDRQLLEQDLRTGINAQQLELHYQPLLDLSTKAIAGFEALVRWHHPRRGLLSPLDFIPLAEESGLILPLGRWVIETACREAASWESPLRIAVNLSPVQFRQVDLAQMIKQILQETGLAPERLELEVTESVLIRHAEQAVEILTELRDHGVNISLDDFGTGYSSLSYLRKFPFNKMKLDRSFIQALGQDQEAGLITRAIVALGRSLSLAVTAEGVETLEQLHFLEAQQCNNVQGYLIGRPLPAHEIAGLLVRPVEKEEEEEAA